MTDILMPALSPTMEEGVLAKWHVKVGDVVSAGQVIDGFSFDQFAGTVFWDQAGVRSRDEAVKSRALPAPVLAAIRRPEADRTEEDRRAIAAHFRDLSPRLAPVRERRAALAQALPEADRRSVLGFHDRAAGFWNAKLNP